MSSEKLLQKFLSDKHSLSGEELETLYRLLAEDNNLAIKIKEDWLIEESISRLIATDRKMFSAQILKRIADDSSDESKVLSFDDIVKGSKKSHLTQSGRYVRKKDLEMPTSSRRVGQRHRQKKSSSNRNYFIIAALLLLSVGFIYLILNSTSKSQVSKTPNDSALNSNNGAITLTSYRGNVSITRLNKALALKPNLTLKKNDTIQSFVGGQVTFSFSDKSTFTLSPDTTCKIESAKQKKLFLAKGSLLGNITKQTDSEKYLIRTENSQIKIVGTEFHFKYVPPGSHQLPAYSELEVIKGVIEYTDLSNGKMVVVKEKEYAYVTKSSPLVVRKTPNKEIKIPFDGSPMPSEVTWFTRKNSQVKKNTLFLKEGRNLFYIDLKEMSLPILVSYKVKLPKPSIKVDTLFYFSCEWSNPSVLISPKETNPMVYDETLVNIFVTEDGYFLPFYKDAKSLGEETTFSYKFKYFKKTETSKFKFSIGGHVTLSDLKISEIKKSDVLFADIIKSKMGIGVIKKHMKTLNPNKNYMMIIPDFPILLNGKWSLEKRTILLNKIK